MDLIQAQIKKVDAQIKALKKERRRLFALVLAQGVVFEPGTVLTVDTNISFWSHRPFRDGPPKWEKRMVIDTKIHNVDADAVPASIVVPLRRDGKPNARFTGDPLAPAQLESCTVVSYPVREGDK